MRIAVFSDLHLEFHSWGPPALDCDVVVLAGDIDVIASGSDVPRWARAQFPGHEIVWVLGNHEYYDFRRGMVDALYLARHQAKESGVHLLENDAVELEGVRFCGCTLWTDFQLRGDPMHNILAAQLAMTDFRGSIRLDDEVGYHWFRPQESIEIHRKSVAWLDAALAEPFAGPTVVVTHHSPSPKCEHKAYAKSSLSPAFCSDLGWLIEKHQPALWVSGHTHASHDVWIGATRLVSNQRGYSNRPEHGDAPFDPHFVVEV